MTTIKLKNGSGAPTAGDLVQGEPALDLTNKRLYTEDSVGTVIEVGTNPGVDVTFADDRKAIFGTGSDLEIYHESSTGRSFIKETGADEFRILGSNIRIKNGGDSKTYMQMTDGGSVAIRHNDSTKLETTSTGIDVTGGVTTDAYSYLNGLRISGADTGNTIYQQSGALSISSASGDISLKPSGATVLTATSSGIDVTGNIVNSGHLLHNNNSGLKIIGGGDATNDGSNLTLYGSTNGSAGTFRFRNGTTTSLEVAGNGDISFYEDTGTTAKLFWDASNEGLGLGTTSPATGYRLDISGNSGYDDIMRITGVGTNIGPRINLTPTGTGTSRINATANSLQLQTGGTAAVTIDSSQNVGIGISSPSALLEVATPSSGSAAVFNLLDNTADGFVVKQGSNEYISVDTTNAAEVITLGNTTTIADVIVPAGNVGIGTSSPEETLSVMGDFQVALNTSVTGRGLKVSTSNTSITDDTVSINAQASTGILAFQTNSTERARIDSSGHLIVKNGGRFYLESSSGFSPFLSESSNNLLFTVNSSERMRIDSLGNLLVGTTTTNIATEGTVIYGSGNEGVMQLSSTAMTALYVNRSNSGELVQFRAANSTVGSIGTTASGLVVGNGDTALFFDAAEDSIKPRNSSGAARDDAIDLGKSSHRFDDIYATNGTIQTSDRNEKQDIEALSDAEQRVAVACKGLLRKFRWKSSVAENGDDARIHFGIIAQDLQAAFEAEGLDAGRYAMFISTTWTDEETGEERTRMGVRYSELLAFIIAAI